MIYPIYIPSILIYPLFEKCVFHVVRVLLAVRPVSRGGPLSWTTRGRRESREGRDVAPDLPDRGVWQQKHTKSY